MRRAAVFCILALAAAADARQVVEFGSPLDVPSSVVNLSTTIRDKTTSFLNMVVTEMDGTRLGAALIVRGREMGIAARDYQEAVRLYRADRAESVAALAALEAALRNVQLTVATVPGAAPQSQVILWDIAQLVGASRAAHNRALQAAGAVKPPPPIPPVVAEARGLVVLCRNFAVGVGELAAREPALNGVYRDALALGAMADSLAVEIETRVAPNAVRRSFVRMRARAADLTRRVGRLPRPAQNLWTRIERQIDGLGRTLGVPADPWVNPDAPVIIDPPSFPDLPVAVLPGGVGGRYRRMAEQADRMLNFIEAEVRLANGLSGTQPRRGPRYAKELREAAAAVGIFRRACDHNAGPPRLRSLFAAVEAQVREAGTARDQLANAGVRFRPDNFANIVAAQNILRRMLP